MAEHLTGPHPIADARDHASQTGDGSRQALNPQSAPKFTVRRRVRVHVRAPFLPEHHGHNRPGLIGHTMQEGVKR